ncbi:hypothetical protein DFS21_11392 [Pseudomonas sp. 2848]|uniref:hypothetical protein n=1 Tax=Pseudomonas sp. 2848 TaxID=2183926 RepID=UPI000DB25581|nr:hypothetical protein [Pseudomonas sp. 2848]PZW75185.1 hypothetical protein DFS21_11392 [Pseudomonas sp. 2848]
MSDFSPLSIFKSQAKQHARQHGMKLSAAQETLSRKAGFEKYHELAVVAQRTPTDPRLMLAAFGVLDFKDSVNQDGVLSDLAQVLVQMLSGTTSQANASEFSLGESEVESAAYNETTGLLTLGMSMTYEGQQDPDRAYHGSAFFLKADVELIRRDGKWSLGEDGVSITSNDWDRAANRHILVTNEAKNVYQKDHSPHEKPIEKLSEDGKRVKNPNEITVNQHVIPQAHLKQWLGGEDLLTIINKSSGEPLKRSPKNSFVVARLWDQPTEQGMIKMNEDNYQQQLKLFAETGSIVRSPWITEYFVMLAARAYFAAKERPLYDSIMVPPSWTPSQAELEDDEVEQVHDTVRIFRGAGNPHATARTVVSMALTQFFIRARELLKDAVWVPFKTTGEKFILPDSNVALYEKRFLALPVSPELVLLDEKLLAKLQEAGQLTPEYLNKRFLESSVRYYVSPK